MGGSVIACGNILPCSEFNFSYDYIAPKIVLNNFKRITIVPWDTTEPHVMTPEDFLNIRMKLTKDDLLFNHSTLFYVEKLVNKLTFLKGGMIINDFYCALCIFNSNVIDKCYVAECNINLDSEVMRGSLTVKFKKKFENYSAAFNYLTNFPHLRRVIIVNKMKNALIKSELSNIFVIIN